jgi:uncharacterized membrane protein
MNNLPLESYVGAKQWLIGYGTSLSVLLALDALWLMLFMGPAYKASIGELMLSQPRLAPAAVFYLLLAVGTVVFATLPALRAEHWQTAAGLGALLGLIAYATYDLTNLSILKGWPLQLSLIDIAWGALLSCCGATAAYFTASRFG